MRPTRILGIAPYEGMKNLLVSIAARIPQVEMTAFVGDLAPGADIVRRYTGEDFDVVLSRGGTAEMIRQTTTMPVVEIDLSVYDILRSIKLAEGSNNRYAIVGFPAITHNASFLCEVLRYKMDLYTIHNKTEARTALEKVAASGCGMVLCDMITSSVAQEVGIPALLITSGAESIESAIHQAVNLSQNFMQQREQIRLLENLLAYQSSALLAFDDTGAPCYRRHADELPDAVMERIYAMRCQLMTVSQLRSTLGTESKQYTLTGRSFAMGQSKGAVFEITNVPLSLSLEKQGIRYLDRDEAFDSFFNSFYGITQSTASKLPVDEIAAGDKPVTVAGELGTGKDQMIRLIYGKSAYGGAPLCLIDCALLQGAGLSFLLESDASPLANTGLTLHFRHLSSLSDEQFMQLFMTIRDLHIHQRNRLIFSCTLGLGGEISKRHKQLLSWFGGSTLTMPSLRSHREDIPHLAMLYISILNMRNAKEITGFEPDALQRLMDYDWPANYDQFKRLLQELVQLTGSAFIRLTDVERLLQREQNMYAPAEQLLSPTMLRGKTLEEIDLLAVQQVLAEENGNQSATAARLGISRTTLWRMLQRSSTGKAELNAP